MTSLDTDQVFHLVISGLIFLIIAVGHHTSQKRISAWALLLMGLSITGIGIIFPCLEGRDCIDVVTFKNTVGMGRAYVYGVGVILASIYVFTVERLKKFSSIADLD